MFTKDRLWLAGVGRLECDGRRHRAGTTHLSLVVVTKIGYILCNIESSQIRGRVSAVTDDGENNLLPAFAGCYGARRL